MNSSIDIIIKIIGYIAAVLGLITFVPQAYKTFKSQYTKSISLLSFTLFTIANITWLIFSILVLEQKSGNDSTNIILWALTLLIPYAVTTFCCLVIIQIKLKNKVKYHESLKAVKEEATNDNAY